MPADAGKASTVLLEDHEDDHDHFVKAYCPNITAAVERLGNWLKDL